MRWTLISVLVALSLPIPGGACAQDSLPRFASTFLPADHWAVAAARRAVALGIAPRELGWTDGSLTRREAGLMLVAAREREPGEVFRALAQRFAEEFPATIAMILGTRSSMRGEGAVVAGYDGTNHEYVPGFAEWIQQGGTGPIPLDARSDIAGGLRWAGSVGSLLGVELSPQRAGGDWNRSEGYAVLRVLDAGLWLGRRSLDYGPGESGGLILNRGAAFTGGGITIGATRLPWIFRHVGPVRFEAFLSEVDSSFAVKDPWVMVNHASASPHPRILIGITHGAIFAGSGRPPFTPRNFLAMVTLGRATKGSADAEFENQLVGGEIRYRVPLGEVPLELHVAWGTEDNQGAWYEVPATQFGARIAAVPGIPTLSLGIERTEFEPPCIDCGNKGFGSNWYRHYIYKAGWTEDQTPLGHPLGGNGVEWLGYGHADLDEARLRIDGRVYYRERQQYNLFAPDLAGFGSGGAVAWAWRFRPGAELLGSAEMERLPNDEYRSAVFLGGRLFF
jgi:hypothetical protein